MKFPGKALYTYNVRSGDSFIIDEKAPPLPKLRSSNSNRMSAAYSPNPQLSSASPYYPSQQRNAVTFAVIDRKKLAQRSQQKSKNISVKRNLFNSSSNEDGTNSENSEPLPQQPFKIWPEDSIQKEDMDTDAGNNNITDSVDCNPDTNVQNIRNHSAGH